jgi:hypothetical protein
MNPLDEISLSLGTTGQNPVCSEEVNAMYRVSASPSLRLSTSHQRRRPSMIPHLSPEMARALLDYWRKPRIGFGKGRSKPMSDFSG